jgi:peptidyl-prolyl cis-trans isomerase D
MLQGIRDSARGWLAWVIVAIISIPFAFWGINEYFSPAPKRVIAEVNGVELLERDFQQEVSRRQQELRQLHEQGRQLRAMLENQQFQNQEIVNLWLYTVRQIQERTNETKESILAQMIAKEVLVQSAVNAGMRIGDALLTSRIHSFPAFQEDGTFSQELYEQTLRYQGMTPPKFEWDIRREMLTSQIREGVLRSALVTDYDQQQRTRLEEQQRSISYLIIPASRFNDSVIITDADIETYYKEQAKQYMTPEKVSIEYVQLSQKDLISNEPVSEQTLKERYQERKASFIIPAQWKARHILIEVGSEATAADIEKAEQKAQELHAKIRAGDAFEELAKQFSDDFGSKRMGGDLGWFGPGRMVKPFEEAVKAMKVGEVSEPVKSQFGLHLIKLEDIKPEMIRPFAQVREQLEKDIQKERAESEFEDQVEQMANLAFEHPDSLEVLTDTLNLESKPTELFDQNGNNQKDSILSHRQVIETAFSFEVLKERANSDVIEIGEQQVAVLRVKDHVPAIALPIADVKDGIKSSLTQEKTEAEAKALGETLLDQIKLHSDPNVVVKEHELKWSSAHWIKRKDTTPKPVIVREAFKMGHPAENKGLYQGLELDNGDFALVAVLAIKDGVETKETPSTTSPEDSEDNASPDPRQQAKQQQQQALGESEFNQLVSGLKTSAEIKDYSKKLLEDS